MKTPIALTAAALLMTLPGHGQNPPTSGESAKPFQPTAESFKQYQCPEWFRDAKFGIWCHWGPDSVPGFNNYARDLWKQGSEEYKWHLDHIGHPSKAGYEAVIESWKAEKFDPDALMARFKAAGAKYFFALATHHDNFDNWDSTYHSWNSVNHGPHKDIIKLWREAAIKAGLRFGVSSHADLRGWCYMYGAQTSDTSGPLAGVPYVGRNPALAELYNTPKSKYEAPPDEWQQKWLHRLTDLVDKYHPDFLYFDSGIPHGKYGMQLIAHYLNENAARNNGKVDAVVNVKAGSFVHDYERSIPLAIQDKPFQAESSLSGWFYMVHHSKRDPASNCKDTPWVIHTLASAHWSAVSGLQPAGGRTGSLEDERAVPGLKPPVQS